MTLQKKFSALNHYISNYIFRNLDQTFYHYISRIETNPFEVPFFKVKNVSSSISSLKAVSLLIGLVSSVPLTVFPAFSQPAPSLQYLQIRRVDSSSAGSESIPDNLFTTIRDHGGAQLRVLTVEVGYGNSFRARMKGANLPASANISSVPYCNPSNFLEPCRSGQKVIGWVRYWRLDGNQSGTFYYQNRSLNAPWNTLSDSINIK
jgi:hypothetical protein